jgi:electron transfer flavoprotein beta subunit
VKILVAIKRVADPNNANKVKVSGDRARVTSEGLEWKLNPFDEYAVEAALRLNENGKTKETLGETVVLCIGPKDAAATIRQALAMGADRGIHVTANDEDLDSFVVGRVIAKIAAKEAPDLLLMGKQAVDGESGATGAIVADTLGWPLATLTMRIRAAADNTLTVGRELDTGVCTLKMSLPAVLTASDRILHPDSVKNGVTPDDFRYPESDGGRFASLKNIMAAKKKSIEETALSAVGVDVTPTSTYDSFELPPARSGNTTFAESVPELVAKLRSDAKVL